MVKGLETFRKAMTPYKKHFVIIGGTACDIRLTGTTMTPRATDDIDIIVVIDRLTDDFVHAIWQFVKDGNYKAGKRVNKQGVNVYALYRFTLQDDSLDYPQKIEILSRHSEFLGEPSGFHIEPIPTDEDRHSLSAIIMDDDYYEFTIHQAEEKDGLMIANNYALIVLKMHAYLNLLAERAAGKKVNTDDIKKHRSDVLKLVAAGIYTEPLKVNAKFLSVLESFTSEVQQHKQSLKDALDVTAEQIDAFLDVLCNEIFAAE